jgi:hypothetical protein
MLGLTCEHYANLAGLSVCNELLSYRHFSRRRRPVQGPLTRVIHQSLCEKQFTLPSRHSLDVDVAGDGNAS